MGSFCLRVRFLARQQDHTAARHQWEEAEQLGAEIIYRAVAVAQLRISCPEVFGTIASGCLAVFQRRRTGISRHGLPPYVIATAIAPVSQYATLAICAALAAFYALPIASGAEKTA